MFNKRHYEAIALLIQDTRAAGQSYGIDLGTIGYVADKLADMLARDNGRFNRERFIAACQPNANVKLRTRYKVVNSPSG